MGIGAAFATGLVKGFTSNIQKEEERRLAEQKKVDAFEQLALKSVLEGKATKEGYASVSSLIKSARQQMEDRPGIDMFGRATDGIDLDLAKLQGAITEASDDFVRIGSVKLKVPEKYFDPSADAKDKANMFMDALNNKMATPAAQSVFLSQFKTEEDRRSLDAEYRGHLGQWIAARGFDSEGKKLVNIDPTTSLGVHKPLSDFLGWNIDKEYETAKAVAATKLDPSGNKELPAGYVLLPVGLNAVGGSAAVSLNQLGFDTPEKLQGLEGLAKFQKMDTGKFIYNYASQFDSQVDFMKGLSHSVSLFNLGAAEPKSMDDNMAVGKYLLSKPDLKNDALARAYAMSAFTVDLRSPQERTLARLGFEAYKDLPFSEEFEKLTGQKLGAFQERTSSLYKARNNLTSLIETIERTDQKVEGVVANTFAAIYGFFGKSGTIDQIRNLVTEGGGYADATSAAKIDAFMKSQLEGVSDDIASARTLAFIAAADLARAEDESGRLSDQDFLRNYRKLGVNISGTVQNQLAAIKTVLGEVNMKYREVEVLNQIVSRGVGGKLTDGDRKLLQGDARAKFFVQNYYNSGGRVEETPATPAPVLPTFEAVTTTTDRYELYPRATSKEGGQLYRDKQTGALVITSNGTVSRMIPKDGIRDAFANQQLIKSGAPVVAPAATAPAAPAPAAPAAPAGGAPAPAAPAGGAPAPAPAPTGDIEYLDVASKSITGNNQKGYSIEGYDGVYKKVTRPDKTIYFTPMK